MDHIWLVQTFARKPHGRDQKGRESVLYELTERRSDIARSGGASNVPIPSLTLLPLVRHQGNDKNELPSFLHQG